MDVTTDLWLHRNHHLSQILITVQLPYPSLNPILFIHDVSFTFKWQRLLAVVLIITGKKEDAKVHLRRCFLSPPTPQTWTQTTMHMRHNHNRNHSFVTWLCVAQTSCPVDSGILKKLHVSTEKYILSFNFHLPQSFNCTYTLLQKARRCKKKYIFLKGPTRRMPADGSHLPKSHFHWTSSSLTQNKRKHCSVSRKYTSPSLCQTQSPKWHI